MNLWLKIIPKIRVDESGCWLWTGSLDSKGYGKLADKPNRKMHAAHRLLYELTVGPIPEGLDLDHLCRVRNCVNPFHMEAVTRQENIARGVGINSRGKTHCIRGHPWNAENITVRGNGSKICRKCAVIRQREYTERKAIA